MKNFFFSMVFILSLFFYAGEIRSEEATESCVSGETVCVGSEAGARAADESEIKETAASSVPKSEDEAIKNPDIKSEPMSEEKPEAIPEALPAAEPETKLQEPSEVKSLEILKPQPLQAPEKKIPETQLNIPKDNRSITLVDDALISGSSIEGVWVWDSALKCSGEKSHTEPAAKGITQHSCVINPIRILPDSVIEQHVYLDPNNMPKGIMLKFRFESDGNEGEIGVYREGEEEVFIFNNDEPMLYEGTLPNAGRWEKLEVCCDDLGLIGANLTGISFVTFGGKVNWDLTRIAPMAESEKYARTKDAFAGKITSR
ncbi:MAG: hypothetical protein V1933_06950 [Candidatus Omnitrophota bacterium]